MTKTLEAQTRRIADLEKELTETKQKWADQVKALEEMQVLKSSRPYENTLIMEPEEAPITGHTMCEECDEKYLVCDCDDKPSHCVVCGNKIHNCSCD